MTITTPIRRPLGTMIVYGYPRAELGGELAIARRIGAELLEILPDWRQYPDPRELVARAEDAGLAGDHPGVLVLCSGPAASAGHPTRAAAALRTATDAALRPLDLGVAQYSCPGAARPAPRPVRC